MNEKINNTAKTQCEKNPRSFHLAMVCVQW